MSSAPRIIKKYPNRRLYDTDRSAYITLPEVKQMVIAQEEFRVVDTKTHADLTRGILLQVILEEETCAAPLFTNALLAQMIRCYGGAMQGLLSACLQRSVDSFAQTQRELQAQSHALYAESLSISGKGWAHLLRRRQQL
jgi:polyhydroxyalkanoate synthesis repressor PhaR